MMEATKAFLENYSKKSQEMMSLLKFGEGCTLDLRILFGSVIFQTFQPGLFSCC